MHTVILGYEVHFECLFLSALLLFNYVNGPKRITYKEYVTLQKLIFTNYYVKKFLVAVIKD